MEISKELFEELINALQHYADEYNWHVGTWDIDFSEQHITEYQRYDPPKAYDFGKRARIALQQLERLHDKSEQGKR